MPYSRLGRIQPVYIPDSPNPAGENSWRLEDAWETEPDVRYKVAECGKRRAVVRRGREYMTVSFFCGKWSCPRCAPYFKKRWVDHMAEAVKGKDLYVMEIDEGDWGRVRRSINRLEADYTRVRVGDTLKIITDKPTPGSTSLPGEEVGTFLETAIPERADKCPISTPRTWEHRKKDKSSDDYESVVTTWLPVRGQLEIAEELGGEEGKADTVAGAERRR